MSCITLIHNNEGPNYKKGEDGNSVCHQGNIIENKTITVYNSYCLMLWWYCHDVIRMSSGQETVTYVNNKSWGKSRELQSLPKLSTLYHTQWQFDLRYISISLERLSRATGGQKLKSAVS